MHQVIFDIRQTSALSWTAYIISVAVYLIGCFLFLIIAIKLKEQNRLQWRVMAVPLFMILLIGIIMVGFFTQRAHYMSVLNNKHANVITGYISNVKTGKVEHVTVDSVEFILRGFPEITPAFTVRGILMERQRVTIYYYNRHILRLELL